MKDSKENKGGKRRKGEEKNGKGSKGQVGESKENWTLLHILLVSECHVDVRCVLFVTTYGFGILEVMSGALC